MTDWVQQQLERIHGQQLEEDQKGGPGSGHYGHAGRPGKRGGSVPGNVAVSIRTGQTASTRQRIRAETGARYTIPQALFAQSNDLYQQMNEIADKIRNNQPLGSYFKASENKRRIAQNREWQAEYDKLKAERDKVLAKYEKLQNEEDERKKRPARKEPIKSVQVGDTIQVKVRMRGGDFQERPAKVLATHPGVALHRSLQTDPKSKARKQGYTITHLNSSASVFPRRILSRAAANSALEAVASSGLDWNFEKIGDATEQHLNVIREWSMAHREDLAW